VYRGFDVWLVSQYQEQHFIVLSRPKANYRLTTWLRNTTSSRTPRSWPRSTSKLFTSGRAVAQKQEKTQEDGAYPSHWDIGAAAISEIFLTAYSPVYHAWTHHLSDLDLRRHVSVSGLIGQSSQRPQCSAWLCSDPYLPPVLRSDQHRLVGLRYQRTPLHADGSCPYSPSHVPPGTELALTPGGPLTPWVTR
jgi:hypothetical protein